MAEKRYLKWYNKVGYGSGDIAGNVVYAFLSSFVMIYLTNTVGLNPGIVGTLIAFSKLLDGVTDIFFGSLIDKTHSKMGKARPWMLYGYIGCAITLVAIFAIPTNLGQFAQYAWFLIAYTLLNAVFYTANNIAYSALTALIPKNSAEQVEMGSYRFMFAFATSLLIQSITLGAVTALGGGATGWRTVAIIYAIIGLIVNTLSVFSVKELPESELVDTNDKKEIEQDEKYNLVQAAKLLAGNKYYMMICGTYILQQIYGAMISMGTYYATYILGNQNLFGVFSWAVTARRTDALPKKGASILLFYSLFCRYSSSVWLTTELAVLENASLRVRQQAEPLYLHHLHRSSFSGFYGECFCSSFIVLCGSRRIPLGHSSPHANAPVSLDLLLWKIFHQVLPQGRQLRCGYYLFQKPFSWYPPR